jgi:hypothetical protein
MNLGRYICQRLATSRHLASFPCDAKFSCILCTEKLTEFLNLMGLGASIGGTDFETYIDTL